ncbi:MAG: BNR/Asp-box repeat protein [Chthonomonadales bacterium]|nr:BNR/Asp-box repeat protein [Chthonomonadales bacterium]
MGTLHVVNMIPAAMSGETNQDSEPNIAVNPAQPNDIVATAFTPAPMGGSFAPIYVSTDGGNTWALRTVVPGNGFVGTGDITVGFATTGGVLYAGILNGQTSRMQILRTASFNSTAAMSVLVDRASEDQPWVVAGSVVVGGVSRDRVFVGNEDGNQPGGRTATVDVSQDAATAPAPAGFTPIQLEHRSTVVNKDGPPIRTAFHIDGTVYSAFHRWASGTFPNLNIDVVITRDDNWGASATPFSALVDSGDNVVGQRIATNRFVRFNALMGQERLGGDLSIAVDPAASGTLWVAWCDRVGGMAGTDWTLHVSHSTDRGQTWSADVRTITNAKNPSLAVNSARRLGLVYQLFTGTQWVTTLELTTDSWASAAETHILHQAPSNTPARSFLPYIGDYIRMISIKRDFYGVFCGNNTPDMTNFPSGVTYQRGADFTTRTLLNTDGVTPVPVSIDPFFFHYSDQLISIARGPIARGPIARGPIARGPIARGPIARGPIVPGPIGPISREPPAPIGLPQNQPAPPASAPDQPAAPKRAGKRTVKSPKPPTDMDL